MKDRYITDETSRYLQYLDANNLYGWTMIQRLPAHKFEWEKMSMILPLKKQINWWKKTDKDIFPKLIKSIKKIALEA